MTEINLKQIYKAKMQTAIENFMTAEEAGAKKLAPATYAWAKAKIYNNKKILLQYPDDEKKVQEATDDAAAAAAKLLAKVREKKRQSERTGKMTPEQAEKEALKILINEGGPVA